MQSRPMAEISAARTHLPPAPWPYPTEPICQGPVDMENGSVKVLDYTAVHDIGKALNPMGVEGQIEGAVQMGIGYALTEALYWMIRER